MSVPSIAEAPPARDPLRDAAAVARGATGLAGVASLLAAQNQAQWTLSFWKSFARVDDPPMPYAVMFAAPALLAAFGVGLLAIALRWRRNPQAATLTALTVVAGLAAWRFGQGSAWTSLSWMLWPLTAGLAWLFVKERRSATPDDPAAPVLALLGLSLAPLLVGEWMAHDAWISELQSSAIVAVCATLAMVLVRAPPALPPPPTGWRWLGLAAAAFAFLWWSEVPIAHWLFTPAGWASISFRYDDSLRSLTVPQRWLALALLAPVFEELLFRHMLFPWLTAFVGMRRAAVLQATAFALVHHEPAFIPFIFVSGLALAWLRWCGGLPACLAAHALWNGLCAWGFAP